MNENQKLLVQNMRAFISFNLNEFFFSSKVSMTWIILFTRKSMFSSENLENVEKISLYRHSSNANAHACVCEYTCYCCLLEWTKNLQWIQFISSNEKFCLRFMVDWMTCGSVCLFTTHSILAAILQLHVIKFHIKIQFNLFSSQNVWIILVWFLCAQPLFIQLA